MAQWCRLAAFRVKFLACCDVLLDGRGWCSDAGLARDKSAVLCCCVLFTPPPRATIHSAYQFNPTTFSRV